MTDNVTLKNVEIGIESKSGKAVCVKIGDEWKWIPLSVVNAMHRSSKSHDSDSIEIERWFADKEGLEP